MAFLLFAALSLISTDLPRIRPVVPKVPKQWEEVGNRHARRRAKKLGIA
jgi:hypothetical protein